MIHALDITVEDREDMAKTEIRCTKCGSLEYKLLDAKSGEVACRFCRNQWIEPALKRMSETEKFLEEQAKQPRVIYDNTTETDEKLMNMIGGLAGGGIGRAFRNPLRKALGITALIVFLMIVCLIISIIGGLRTIIG